MGCRGRFHLGCDSYLLDANEMYVLTEDGDKIPYGHRCNPKADKSQRGLALSLITY